MFIRNAYSEIAEARARELRTRMAFAVFITGASCYFTRSPIPLAWLGAVSLFQFAEFRLFRPLRLGEQAPSEARCVAFAAMVAVNAVIWCTVAVFAWFNGDTAGKLFAILGPAGALLNVALTMERPTRLLMATWAPHIATLLGLPMLHAALSPQADLVPAILVSLGAGMLLLQVVGGVRRIRRTTEAWRAARDLAEREQARAERASAAKSDFLATMSHEIRTPMNAVLSAAGLLRRTTLTPTQTEHVDMLSSASELLMGLLNDVLDLSKIESGKLAVAAQEVALVDKLAVCVGLWRSRAEEKGVRLDFNADTLPSRVMIDPLRLQQIVFNLLSNAVKFTDSGTIQVRGGRCARDGEAMLWIEVQDSGCGMDAETCERVFASFEQGSMGVTRTHGGTGLGLTISRRLAELMGGALTVTSVEGRGSTFRLEAPLIEIEAPAAQPADAAKTEETAAAVQLNLLLAEDHEVNQRIVRLILEPLGCRVTVAENGAEAVALADGQPFDVIVMDMQMPVMGGVEATRLIRAGSGPNADTPVLALTANVMDEHRAAWAAVGVQTFLTKPIDMRVLIDSVCQASSAARPVRQAA